MDDLLREVRAKHHSGDLNPDCAVARLLDAIDPATGQPLHDDLILTELAAILLAGVTHP